MNCHKLALKGLAGSVSAVALIASASAFAQDTQEDQATPVTTNAPTDEEEAETVARTDAEGTPATNTEGAIVVTGSRVKQPSTYNSISPLQVLTAEASRDVGEFDPGLNYVQRAIEKGYYVAQTLERRTQFDALRDQPVFQSILTAAREGCARSLTAFRNAGGERLLGRR